MDFFLPMFIIVAICLCIVVNSIKKSQDFNEKKSDVAKSKLTGWLIESLGAHDDEIMLVTKRAREHGLTKDYEWSCEHRDAGDKVLTKMDTAARFALHDFMDKDKLEGAWGMVYHLNPLRAHLRVFHPDRPIQPQVPKLISPFRYVHGGTNKDYEAYLRFLNISRFNFRHFEMMSYYMHAINEKHWQILQKSAKLEASRYGVPDKALTKWAKGKLKRLLAFAPDKSNDDGTPFLEKRFEYKGQIVTGHEVFAQLDFIAQLTLSGLIDRSLVDNDKLFKEMFWKLNIYSTIMDFDLEGCPPGSERLIYSDEDWKSSDKDQSHNDYLKALSKGSHPYKYFLILNEFYTRMSVYDGDPGREIDWEILVKRTIRTPYDMTSE